MFRRIRDEQYRLLKDRAKAERKQFYREKAHALMQQAGHFLRKAEDRAE
jgi:hypothetical protein